MFFSADYDDKLHIETDTMSHINKKLRQQSQNSSALI